MIRYSKRGVTIVELIICCAIIVMVGGACTAVLMSGQTIFNRSSKSANAQLETDILQTYLTQIVPRADNVTQLEEVDDVNDPTSNANSCIYIITNERTNESTFVIRVNGKDNTLYSVVEFEYWLRSAGTANDRRSRPQFVYTVTLDDGSSYTSGFIIANCVYDNVLKENGNENLKNKTKASEHPICFVKFANVSS